MRLFYKFSILILFLFSKSYYSQSNYSLGITLGSGVNLYKNNLPVDKNHFISNKPFSSYFGVKLFKNLDEENKLFADLIYSRKKIEYQYNLNESEIPFDNKEIVGQKYDCISFFVGYRRLLPLNENLIYIEASIGADYNSYVMNYNEGKGEASQELNGEVYYESIYNTNLGEKSYTISANVGFGLNFGIRNQYDIGLSINMPFQKIQTKESNFQYIWQYETREYKHQLNYTGKVYFPSLKLTYYIF